MEVEDFLYLEEEFFKTELGNEKIYFSDKIKKEIRIIFLFSRKKYSDYK